jgi:hypothetical protein
LKLLRNGEIVLGCELQINEGVRIKWVYNSEI